MCSRLNPIRWMSQVNVLETKTAEAESRTMETELQVKPLRCARTQNRSDAFLRRTFRAAACMGVSNG